MTRFTLLKPYQFSGLSGALAALSYPGYGFDGVAWVALVPLLWVSSDKPLVTSFRHGWWAGFVYFLLILPWLWTLWDWAGAFIVLGYMALCALMALSWGAWAAGCSWLTARRPARLLLAAPALWTALEFLRGAGPFGFTWGDLGYALYRQGSILQLASWTGVWGLSFLIVFVNAGLLVAWKRRKLRVVLLVGLVLLGVVGWGNWQRGEGRRRMVDAPTRRIALVQPNIPQREKSDPRMLDSLRERVRSLLDGIDQNVDLVVLPESILPTLILEDSATLEMLSRFAQDHRAAVLFGSFTAEDDGLFNSAVLLTSEGEVIGQYDKVQLVPFSTEYFPLINVLKRAGLDRWLGPLSLGSLSRGAGFGTLAWGEITLGAPICFESAFGRISRAFVRRGANLIVTITNDAWFKDSMELEQHFAMGIVRAVETGRAFVQVANTGLSGAVNPVGEVLLKVPPHQATVAYVDVPLLQGQTGYVRLGDWFMWAVGFTLLGFILRRQYSHHPLLSRPL